MALTIETYEKRLAGVKITNYYYDLAQKTLALIRHFKGQQTCESFVNLSYLKKALDNYAEIEITQNKDQKYEYNIRSLQFPKEVKRKIETDYNNRINFFKPNNQTTISTNNKKENGLEK